MPDAVIIMISGHANIKMAIDATRLGADDFLEKPLSKDKLLLTLKNFVKRLQLQEKYSALERNTIRNALVGESEAIKTIRGEIKKIAPTKSKVLITGESGTGKEIIAHMIHSQSGRRNSNYVKINCAAIPEELIEAELFGAEKGAYTGANERREGKFQAADGGTLFLDEIADMSFKTQTKVLRVLQEGEFERLGSNETLHTDVRVIAATNRDLQKMVADKTFREDLFYRLNVLTLHVPPLRERAGDIKLLTDHFLTVFSRENNRRPPRIAEAVSKKLGAYHWPGNIRELKNLIERLVIMSEGDTIEAGSLPDSFQERGVSAGDAFQKKQNLRAMREEAETRYIAFCLEKFDGSVSKTARFLDVDRTHLYKKLQKYGLK